MGMIRFSSKWVPLSFQLVQQSPVTSWEKLKESELAQEAERQMAGTGWMPDSCVLPHSRVKGETPTSWTRSRFVFR
jgi:hypothetical protein